MTVTSVSVKERVKRKYDSVDGFKKVLPFVCAQDSAVVVHRVSIYADCEMTSLFLTDVNNYRKRTTLTDSKKRLRVPSTHFYSIKEAQSKLVCRQIRSHSQSLYYRQETAARLQQQTPYSGVDLPLAVILICRRLMRRL